MRPFRIAVWIGLAAGFASAFEVTGRITAEEDGRPLAGVLVRLLVHGDSALTDSTGAFRLNPENSGIRPGSPSAGTLQARLRAGTLEYRSAGGGAARIELYGTRGERLQTLRYLPSSPGMQRVGLASVTAMLRGMGWLRLSADGRAEWVRILGLGAGLEPLALGPQGGTAGSAPAHTAALAKTSVDFADTLRADKPGFYPVTQSVTFASDQSGPYDIPLWKNTLYGMDPAEVAAWKAHLTKPALDIYVSPTRISFSPDLTEVKVELADGTEAASWNPGDCLPGPRPKSVRVAYTRQGREYRDTVSLDAIWKLLDSFRSVGADSLGPDQARYHLAWDWPKGFSAVPERDWIELAAISGFYEDHSLSRPDVFQYGIGRGIEGGMLRYDGFDPARGAWDLKSLRRVVTSFSAEFTVARRDDHDLRLFVGNRSNVQTPIRFDYVNAWPADGILPAGQLLRLQAKSEPASAFADTAYTRPKLALIPAGAEYGTTLKSPWNGSSLDWTFPFPIRDTVSFRLKTWASDALETISVCQIPALSPVLRAVPSPTDTTVNAFEPNEAPAQAALVPFGQWIEAAWDYRPSGIPDADYYRFQAPAGSRFSFRLRNPNDKWILLDQSFSDGDSGFGPEAGQEMERTYTMRDSGEHTFDIRPIYFPGGRYSFRIDPVP